MNAIRLMHFSTLLLIAAAGSATADDIELPAWAPALRAPEPDGWEFMAVSGDEDRVFFATREGASRESSRAAIWTRVEFEVPQQGTALPFLSSRTRLEFDCGVARYRLVAATGYAGRALTGESNSPPFDADPAWQPVPADTVMADLKTWACELGDS